MSDNTRLIEAALTLRAFAPDAWSAFVVAAEEYAVQARDDMLRCDVNVLQRAQGRAAMAAEIHQLLRDAPKLAEQKQKTRR